LTKIFFIYAFYQS